MLGIILTNNWVPFYLGMFLVVISSLVVSFYIRKRNRREFISDGDKLVLVPMLIAGIWGPLCAAVGIAFVVDYPLAMGVQVLLALWLAWFYFAWPRAISDRRSVH